jgi:hypothetical protein
MSRPAASGGDHGRQQGAKLGVVRRPTETHCPNRVRDGCSMRGAPLESVRADRGVVSCFEADNEGEALDPIQLMLMGKQD